MVKLTLPSKRLAQAWSQNANGEYEEASPRRSQSARPASAQPALRVQSLSAGQRPMSAHSTSSPPAAWTSPSRRPAPTFVTEYAQPSERTIAVGNTLIDTARRPPGFRPAGTAPSPRRVSKQISGMQSVPGSMAMLDTDLMVGSPRHLRNITQGSRRGSIRPSSAMVKRTAPSGTSTFNATGSSRAMENLNAEGTPIIDHVLSGGSSKAANQTGEAFERTEFIQLNTNEALSRLAPNDIRVQSDRIQAHQLVHIKDRDRHVAASANPIHRRRLRAAIMAVKLGVSDKWSDDAASKFNQLLSSSSSEPAKSGKKLHPHSWARRTLINREMSSLSEAEHYVELAYEADYLGIDDEHGQLKAANGYDARHIAAAHFTQARAATMSCVPTSISHSNGFRAGLVNIMRNRYFEHEKYDPFGPVISPREARRIRSFHKSRKKWLMDSSLWAPRKATGNSKDYFETNACLLEMLGTDWHMARQHHELAWVICKAQLTDDALKELDVKDRLDGVLFHPAVEAVHDAFKRHAYLFYNAFEYYCQLELKIPKGRALLKGMDIFSMTLSQFVTLVNNLNILGDSVDIGHCSNIFSVVNAPDKRTNLLEHHNDVSGLNRHEFLGAIVRLAIVKFGRRSGQATVKVKSMADAVDTFFHEHLATSIDRASRPGMRNLFRKRFCYREDVTLQLEAHKGFLKNLFAVYAGAGNAGLNDHTKLEDRKLMSIGEWLVFVEHAGLVELGFVSSRQALEAFLWSRIRCATDHSHLQILRLRQLSFEDFVEALVRIASIVPVPTLQEVEEAGAADAGDFILALYSKASQKTYQAFLMGRTTGWEDHPCARIFVCVKHLIELICAVILANCQAAVHGRKPGPLTMQEIESFYEHRLQQNGGKMLLPENLVDADALIRAMSKIEDHLVQVLASVPAFAALTDDNLLTLRGAMRCAKFSDGEYVIEQGEVGDSFFLITGGVCDVLRYNPDDPEKEEFVLNTLSTPDCFGEAALLTNAVRNATIMAKGDLYTLFIDRDSFEAALGPLKNFQIGHADSRKQREGTVVSNEQAADANGETEPDHAAQTSGAPEAAAEAAPPVEEPMAAAAEEDVGEEQQSDD